MENQLAVITTKCRECGADKIGDGDYCVGCFRRLTVPCPDCVRIDAKGRQFVRPGRYKGGPKWCKTCGNRRYVLSLP